MAEPEVKEKESSRRLTFPSKAFAAQSAIWRRSGKEENAET
jgi:hypothetical protein